MTQVLRGQLIARIHRDGPFESLPGLRKAACPQEGPTEVVDQLLILRFQFHCPPVGGYRLFVQACITGAVAEPPNSAATSGYLFTALRYNAIPSSCSPIRVRNVPASSMIWQMSVVFFRSESNDWNSSRPSAIRLA